MNIGSSPCSLPNQEQQLSRLRRAIAKSEPLLDETRVSPFGIGEVDAALGGGLACAALHEVSAAPLHLGAAAGFALMLAARAPEQPKQALWIATDFGMLETGGLYGPGLDQIGLPSAKLLIARVARPVDALFAAEEALKCRALGAVVAELNGEADLTATRRLTLAAREGGALGLLLRHKLTDAAERGLHALAGRGCAERAGRIRRPRAHGLPAFAHTQPPRPVRHLDTQLEPS